MKYYVVTFGFLIEGVALTEAIHLASGAAEWFAAGALTFLLLTFAAVIGAVLNHKTKAQRP